MQAATKALRAITYVVFRRLFIPICWVVIGIIVVLWTITLLLGLSVDSSWLWALILLAPLTFAVTIVLTALWLLSKQLAPRRLSREERQGIAAFTDKILRLAETRATPWPVIAALIAKDVVRGRRSSYIEGLISDSKSLKSDFTEIKRLFE